MTRLYLESVAAEQLVDRRVGDAIGLAAVPDTGTLLTRQTARRCLIKATSRSAAASRSSLTTTTSNSSSAASSIRAGSSRRRTRSGSSVPRPVSRRASSSNDGGARNTSSASGIALAHLPGALQLDLQQRRHAGGELLLHDRRARRAVASCPANAACSSSSPAVDHAVELGLVDEVVLHAVGLPRPRRRGSSR